VRGFELLCEQRLQRFLEQRGLALWDYRMLDVDPVPDNLRFQVLKDGGGRCARPHVRLAAYTLEKKEN
jgi:hypothetical protein